MSREAVKIFDSITSDLSEFSPDILGDSNSYCLYRNLFYSGKKRFLKLGKIVSEFSGTSLREKFDIGNMVLRFSTPSGPEKNLEYVHQLNYLNFVSTDFENEDEFRKSRALFEEATKRPLFLSNQKESYVIDQGSPREDLHALYVSMPFYREDSNKLSLEDAIVRKLFAKKLTQELLSDKMLHYGRIIMNDGLSCEGINTFGSFEGPIIVGHEKEFCPKRLIEIVRDSGRAALEAYREGKKEIRNYKDAVERIDQFYERIELLNENISEKEKNIDSAMNSLYNKLKS